MNGYPAADPNSVLGANDCMQLQELNQIARRDILERHMKNGVEIPCTDGVMIGPDVTIGRDVCILPGSILRGHTTVGDKCQIGPNACLTDTQVRDKQTLISVVAQNTVLDKPVTAFSQVGSPPHSHH